MTRRYEDIYGRPSAPETLCSRKSDVLAEMCRAIVASNTAEQAVQDVARRFQQYFGAACLGIWFIRGDQLVLSGISLPAHLQHHERTLRARWGSVPSDSELPGPTAMRRRSTGRWTARAPDVDPPVRAILSDMGAQLLIAVPALGDGDPSGFGIVIMPADGDLTSEDESLLEAALGMLGTWFQRARAQERDRHSQPAKIPPQQLASVDDLAAGVAHEVNNPLSAITHLSELLLQDERLGEEAGSHVRAILQEAQRAAVTIRRLQSSTRAGRIPGDTPDERGERPAIDPARGLRILVVEDEEAVALPIVKYLRRIGHDVTDVRSAEKALERLEAGDAPDVIFSDVRMPGAGGQGLYRALSSAHPELVDRLVFTSGDVASPETESFLRSTGRPVLAKPYPLHALETVFAKVARGRSGRASFTE